MELKFDFCAACCGKRKEGKLLHENESHIVENRLPDTGRRFFMSRFVRNTIHTHGLKHLPDKMYNE